MASTASRIRATTARLAAALAGPSTSSVFCVNSDWPAACSVPASASKASELAMNASACLWASVSAARCSASACCNSTSARLRSSS